MNETGEPTTIAPETHGIYRTRSGKIVGPMLACGGSRWSAGNAAGSWSSGGCFREDGRADPRDVIACIVVGDGWLPWNGGLDNFGILRESEGLGAEVEIVFRDGDIAKRRATVLDWNHWRHPSDIVAYRAVAEDLE